MRTFPLLVILLSLVASCRIADISENHTHLSPDSSALIAQLMLDQVIAKQGFDSLKKANTYEFTAHDHWPGFIGKIAGLWPDQHTTFKFHMNFNTFDAQAIFLTGAQEGTLIGLQSWQYYEQPAENDSIVQVLNDERSQFVFGLAVFHYFLELPYRLRNAPFHRYYGEQEINATMYDRVFVSWKGEAPHPDFDQYILYINKSTRLVDYCIYTLRDNKNPFTRNKYGSIALLNYQNYGGFWAPTEMPIMLDDGVLKHPTEDYFHKISISDLQLGSFPEEKLYPLEGIAKMIDAK